MEVADPLVAKGVPARPSEPYAGDRLKDHGARRKQEAGKYDRPRNPGDLARVTAPMRHQHEESDASTRTEQDCSAQLALPVRAADVADIGRAAGRLHPEQFLEVDRLALGLDLLRALLRRVDERRCEEGMPQRAMTISRPSGTFRTMGAGWSGKMPGMLGKLPTLLFSALNRRRTHPRSSSLSRDCT